MTEDEREELAEETLEIGRRDRKAFYNWAKSAVVPASAGAIELGESDPARLAAEQDAAAFAEALSQGDDEWLPAGPRWLTAEQELAAKQDAADFAEALSSIGLAQYATAFADVGYSSIGAIVALTEDERENLAEETLKMGRADRKAFYDWAKSAVIPASAGAIDDGGGDDDDDDDDAGDGDAAADLSLDQAQIPDPRTILRRLRGF